jgi:thioredoxin
MQEIIDSKIDFTKDKIIVIDFWADWCAPCKMLAPIFKKIASEFPQFTFYKANVDENPRLTTQHEITGVPAIVIFKDGQVLQKLHGLQTETKLRDILNRITQN